MKGGGDALGENLSDFLGEFSGSSNFSFDSRSIFSAASEVASFTVFNLVLLLKHVVGNP